MASKDDNTNIKDELISSPRKGAVINFTQSRETLEASNMPPKKVKQKTFLSMTLNPKHGYLNLLAIPIVFLVHQALQSDMTSLTFYMLQDEFGVSNSDIGQVQSSLLFYPMPIQCISVILVGYLYDIVGRKLTLTVCFTLVSVALFFHPYVAPSIYPGLLLLRILFGMAIVPVYANPLINDYITEDSRGAAFSVQKFGQSLGHLFASNILFKFTKTLDYKISFAIPAGIGIFTAFLCAFIVSEPDKAQLMKLKRRASKLYDGEQQTMGQQVKEKSRIVWHSIRTMPAITISLIACFVGYMQSPITGNFMLIWVNKFISDDGPIHNKQEAQAIFENIGLIQGIINLVTFYFVGLLIDKINIKIIFPLSYFATSITLLSFVFVASPSSAISYILWGIYQITSMMCLIVNETYYSYHIPKEVRGLLFGCMVSAGFMGKALCVLLGGYLIDEVGANTPFEFVGICNLVYTIFALIMIFTGIFSRDMKKHGEQDKEVANEEGIDEGKTGIDDGTIVIQDNEGNPIGEQKLLKEDMPLSDDHLFESNRSKDKFENDEKSEQF